MEVAVFSKPLRLGGPSPHPSNSCHPELAEEPALLLAQREARDPEAIEGEAEWDHVVGSGCLLLAWGDGAPFIWKSDAKPKMGTGRASRPLLNHLYGVTVTVIVFDFTSLFF